MRTISREKSGAFLSKTPFEYARNREFYLQKRTFNPETPWWTKKEWSKIDISNFDSNRKGSREYLTLIANGLLYKQSKIKHYTEHPMILTPEMFRERKKREINPVEGIPDPAIVNGMYWRTHPDGRKWNDQSRRQEGRLAFYE